MAVYNIYLGEIGKSGLTEEEKKNTKSKLEEWFGKIVDTADTVLATWTTSMPATIKDHEMLVYFVSSSGSSILKFMPGNSQGGGSDNGLTIFGSLSASEIYVSSSRSGLAELTFHELMHNKLQLSDANLHGKDGLAVKTVPLNGQPSPNNIKEMKAALKNGNKQWTGGWTAAIDPSNGYL